MVWKDNTVLEQELGSSGVNAAFPLHSTAPLFCMECQEGSSWEISTSLPIPSPATRQNLGGPKADKR